MSEKNIILQASQLFFFLPLTLSIIFQMYTYAVIIFIALVFSFLYHGVKKYNFYHYDKTSAQILILSNVVLCILGHFVFPYFLIVCLLIPISFYYFSKKNNYIWNHSLWHVVSAYICTFSILTFYVGR
jgi:hypothetical protein